MLYRYTLLVLLLMIAAVGAHIPVSEEDLAFDCVGPSNTPNMYNLKDFLMQFSDSALGRSISQTFVRNYQCLPYYTYIKVSPPNQGLTRPVIEIQDGWQSTSTSEIGMMIACLNTMVYPLEGNFHLRIVIPQTVKSQNHPNAEPFFILLSSLAFSPSGLNSPHGTISKTILSAVIYIESVSFMANFAELLVKSHGPLKQILLELLLSSYMSINNEITISSTLKFIDIAIDNHSASLFDMLIQRSGSKSLNMLKLIVSRLRSKPGILAIWGYSKIRNFLSSSPGRVFYSSFIVTSLKYFNAPADQYVWAASALGKDADYSEILIDVIGANVLHVVPIVLDKLDPKHEAKNTDLFKIWIADTILCTRSQSDRQMTNNNRLSGGETSVPDFASLPTYKEAKEYIAAKYLRYSKLFKIIQKPIEPLMNEIKRRGLSLNVFLSPATAGASRNSIAKYLINKVIEESPNNHNELFMEFKMSLISTIEDDDDFSDEFALPMTILRGSINDVAFN